MEDNKNKIIQQIESVSCSIANEKELQEGLEKILKGFNREHSFGPRDRVDFFNPETGLAVEVKISGSANRLIMQMMRYMEKPDVTSGLLVTTSRRLAAQMPNELRGKPVFVALVSAFM